MGEENGEMRRGWGDEDGGVEKRWKNLRGERKYLKIIEFKK